MTARDPGTASPVRPDAAPPRQSPRRRWPLIVLALVAVAAIAGGAYGFAYLFLREEAPPAVGLGTASPSVAASAPAASGSVAPSGSAVPAGSAATGGSLDGSWAVDPSVGSFSDFSSSFVGYRVEEELANVGAATAVGRTPDVTGSVTVSGTAITAAEFTADLTTLESDDDRRDGQLRRQGIETGTFPTATFTLTAPIDLGSVPAEGQVVSATATGDLMLHGVTNSVQIPLEARLSGSVITVTGSTTIVFADYDIEPPSSFIVLSIADQGILEVQLQLTKV
ncbi:MAG TPA: YceI family protein [Candidatus Limnocylindrales bacterium]|nr:YceI family protein [Candidatus Limnocylindrales bacterium]